MRRQTDFMQPAPPLRNRLLGACLCFLLGTAPFLHAESPRHRYFTTPDGLKLHYLEAGSGQETLVFVPGWMMPADVFTQQVQTLSKHYRVIAFDPRSQGRSTVSTGSHAPAVRNRDLRQLLEEVAPGRLILAGWSLGVLEILDFLSKSPQKNLAGLVLIDNSIGFGPPPQGRTTSSNSTVSRSERLRAFVASLTKKPIPQTLFETLHRSALRIPETAAQEMVRKPYSRDHWRNTLLKQKVPVLYAVRPQYEVQGRELQAEKPSLARMVLFPKAGHALFLDDPGRFNQAVLEFAKKSFQ